MYCNVVFMISKLDGEEIIRSTVWIVYKVRYDSTTRKINDLCTNLSYLLFNYVVSIHYE